MLHRSLALLATLLAVSPAHALLIDVGGESWDVDLISLRPGFDDAEIDLLRSQTWWGNPDRAFAFAEAVRDGLGVPGQPIIGVIDGPLFAYEFTDHLCPYASFGCAVDGVMGWSWDPFSHEIDVNERKAWGAGAYAVATSVPEPGTLSLLAVGVLGALATRRRRNGAITA